MKQISEIHKEILLYLTDLENFASNIKNPTTENVNIEKFIFDTKLLNNMFDKLIIELSIDKQKEQVQTAEKLTDKILYQLKILKCKDELIFEKADLIVRIFLIKEKLEKIIQLGF